MQNNTNCLMHQTKKRKEEISKAPPRTRENISTSLKNKGKSRDNVAGSRCNCSCYPRKQKLYIL